jgi:acyl-CoA reductase-like NAD-dependent aldehyde dehydrogenase
MAQDLVIKQSAHLPNKKCLFTLNGKSSLVIYDSADFDSAIESVVDGCYYANVQLIFR